MARRIVARKQKKAVELYLTPVLNIFLNLIPLLLMTAVFLHTSVINLSLPVHPKKTKTQVSAEKNQSPTLLLSIADSGFYLILGGRLLKVIPKKNGYDFDKLELILKKIKETIPKQQSIIIESEDDVVYDHLIQSMDRCRACGLVDIVLSASKRESGNYGK